MYTQSFSVSDQDDAKSAGLKAVPKEASASEQALQAQFDARIDADGRIEPSMSLAALAGYRPAAFIAPASLGRTTRSGIGGPGTGLGTFRLGPLGETAHEAGPARLGLLDHRGRGARRRRLDLGPWRLGTRDTRLVAPVTVGLLEMRAWGRPAFLPALGRRTPGLAWPELRPPGLPRVRGRPASRHPEVAVAAPVPVAVDPDIAHGRRQSGVFDPGRRRGRRGRIDRGRIGGSVDRAVIHRARHHGAARQGRRREQEKREMRGHGRIVGAGQAGNKGLQQLLTAVTPWHSQAFSAGAVEPGRWDRAPSARLPAPSRQRPGARHGPVWAPPSCRAASGSGLPAGPSGRQSRHDRWQVACRDARAGAGADRPARAAARPIRSRTETWVRPVRELARDRHRRPAMPAA